MRLGELGVVLNWRQHGPDQPKALAMGHLSPDDKDKGFASALSASLKFSIITGFLKKQPLDYLELDL